VGATRLRVDLRGGVDVIDGGSVDGLSDDDRDDDDDDDDNGEGLMEGRSVDDTIDEDDDDDDDDEDDDDEDVIEEEEDDDCDGDDDVSVFRFFDWGVKKDELDDVMLTEDMLISFSLGVVVVGLFWGVSVVAVVVTVDFIFFGVFVDRSLHTEVTLFLIVLVFGIVEEDVVVVVEVVLLMVLAVARMVIWTESAKAWTSVIQSR